MTLNRKSDPMRHLIFGILITLLLPGCDFLDPTGSLLEQQLEASTPVSEELTCILIPEQHPDLLGGLEHLQSQLRYPADAELTQGRVILQFMVTEQGLPADIVVARGLGPLFDEEATRVVSLARFNPAQQRGKAVAVKMSLPLTFVAP